MKRIDTNEVRKAVAQFRDNPEELAKTLGVSKSHAYYLIRNHADSAPVPAATDNSEPTTQAVTTATTTTQDQDSGDKVHIIRTNVDYSAFIPPVDKQYKMRDVDRDIEAYSNRLDFATMLVGEAGSGKTYSIQQYAARKGLPFLRVACDDAVALREMLGRREIKQGTTFFKYGLMLEFLQNPSVILFDEFNALTSGKLFFLHEILDKMSDGRRVFVKEADTVINISKQCHIFLACNPNSAKYSGTNKLNVALADRARIINFQPFSVAEIKDYFDCGKKETTDALKAYYQEARKLIASSGMRAVFSIRAVKRIAESVKAGDDVAKALEHNFYNMALLTATETEREQLYNLAKVCFGLEVMKGAK